MIETIGEVSGWVCIRKHTRFRHGVFDNLGSSNTGQKEPIHPGRFG